jgi:cellulose synthase/poly-beta-1,6-N-acetylglucosamine synthase-like glycosyltransferase
MITDADCRPPSTWIAGIVRHFDPPVGLVAGHVREGGDSLGHKLRALERLSVAAVAAGAMGWGRGLSARGGNLSYRREVFEEVGGLTTLHATLSGDDDLFVQLVSRTSSWQMKYVLGPETAVTTLPPEDLRQALAQERRRTSKGKQYPPWVQGFLAATFLMNLFLLVAGPFSAAQPGTYPLPLIAFASKVTCELLILIRAVRLTGRKGLLRFFPLAAILHIPYFVIFSVSGTLAGYRWKGKTDNK